MQCQRAGAQYIFVLTFVSFHTDCFLKGCCVAEFYEFHDSELLEIQKVLNVLTLRINAYRHLRPEGSDEREWTGWTQMILLEVTDPGIENEFFGFPVTISGGYFSAKQILANAEDCVSDELPASLQRATDAELKISGWNDEHEEYKDMVIRGSIIRIVHREEPVFVENWIRS